MAARFRVGLAPDLLDAAGNPTFGAENFAVLDSAPEIERAWLPDRDDITDAIRRLAAV